MTPSASCRGKARGCGGEADEDYLVILSAALWASAPHSSSVFRLSCSVNHGFNIYLTIQYLPRRFAARVTEERCGEDPIKHSLHHAFKGEVGREEERMENVSSIATRHWCKVCWNRARSAARNVFLQTVLCRIHSTGYTHLVRCVSALQENDSHLKFNLQYKYFKKQYS